METALNNFVEADFEEHAISLIMADAKTARAIQDDTGPLKGTVATNLEKRLERLGVDPKDASEFSQLVEEGNALLAVAADDESVDAAKEMFCDYQPAKVTVRGK